jgi:hypothetical protein
VTKILNVWTFIVFGLLIGLVCISIGIRKNMAEKGVFNLVVFLKKGLYRSSFSSFTGLEVTALGVLSILSSILIYWLYFNIYMK